MEYATMLDCQHDNYPAACHPETPKSFKVGGGLETIVDRRAWGRNEIISAR